MTIWARTESTERPPEVETTKARVFVYENIEEEEHDGATVYVFDMEEYTIDEYIAVMSEENAALKNDVTDLQVALCDLYESMGA